MVNEKERYLFESAPVLKAILRLAIPSVISQLILVIYNLADTFFVGLAAQNNYFISNNLDEALVAGVTICMPVFMIISAISNLFGVGAASVMSRSAGKQRFGRANNASRFAIYGCLVTTIVYCLLVLAIINPITSLLAGSANPFVQSYARTYIIITVVSFGLPTAMNTLFSHLVRAEGKAFHASFGIALGGILNVIFDYLFIFVFFPIEKAAFSAALATGLSNVVALIYYIILFIRIRKDTLISFKVSKTMFKEGIPGEVLKIGLPACLMTLCENISYMILDNCIGTVAKVSSTISQEQAKLINTATLAGVGVAKKVNMIAHSIARGMTQGVLPLIGYNKSSGRRIRMKKIVYTSTAITTGIAIICMIINMTCARPLCSIFGINEDALKYASKYLIIFSIGAPFSAFAYSIISFFQAVGKAWRSLILALLRKGILDIPLMFILPLFINYDYGVGVVWATPIADIICSIVAGILFIYYLKRHGAKDKNIVQHDESTTLQNA